MQKPIACSEIPPFRELGTGGCFFGLDEPPLSIAGRIIEYLGHTSTHKMFRNVMRRCMGNVVCKKQVIPFLREIVGQVPKGAWYGLIHDWGWP